jgi:hypothetical protein
LKSCAKFIVYVVAQLAYGGRKKFFFGFGFMAVNSTPEELEKQTLVLG